MRRRAGPDSSSSIFSHGAAYQEPSDFGRSFGKPHFVHRMPFSSRTGPRSNFFPASFFKSQKLPTKPLRLVIVVSKRPGETTRMTESPSIFAVISAAGAPGRKEPATAHKSAGATISLRFMELFLIPVRG